MFGLLFSSLTLYYQGIAFLQFFMNEYFCCKIRRIHRARIQHRYRIRSAPPLSLLRFPHCFQPLIRSFKLYLALERSQEDISLLLIASSKDRINKNNRAELIYSAVIPLQSYQHYPTFVIFRATFNRRCNLKIHLSLHKSQCKFSVLWSTERISRYHLMRKFGTNTFQVFTYSFNGI